MRKKKPRAEVLELRPWMAVEFPHFIGVRHLNGRWTHLILKTPGAPVLDLEALGLTHIELHANGIEWVA